MSDGALEAEVRALVAAHAPLPAGDDAPLELPSLSLVVLAEELEARFGLVVAARELRPENFGSVSRLCAWLRRKRAP